MGVLEVMVPNTEMSSMERPLQVRCLGEKTFRASQGQPWFLVSMRTFPLTRQT